MFPVSLVRNFSATLINNYTAGPTNTACRSLNMNIEMFTLVDHAEDHQGKLTVCGTFDTINAPTYPAAHPHCCLALRMRFQRSEEGEHAIRILLVDSDGREQNFKFEAKTVVVVPPDSESATRNLVIALNGLPLQKPDSYYWDLVVDGQLVSRLPMYAKIVQQGQRAA